uniref:Uncharacterized protein n=1 Tax=Kalanchoe fedtschenkoi TaxID=63787 RepID=A0A7N0SWS7_KALFE
MNKRQQTKFTHHLNNHIITRRIRIIQSEYHKFILELHSFLMTGNHQSKGTQCNCVGENICSTCP